MRLFMGNVFKIMNDLISVSALLKNSILHLCMEEWPRRESYGAVLKQSLLFYHPKDTY